MTTDEITVDHDDCKHALAVLSPTGEHYVVRYASVWRGEDCIGSRIIASDGPIYSGDITEPLGLDSMAQLSDALPALYDLMDRWNVEETDDAEGLQRAEDDGSLTYPYGAR